MRRTAARGVTLMLAMSVAVFGLVAPANAAPATTVSQAKAAAATKAAGKAVRGGRTTVTTGPGIAATLLKNGILPVVTWPGREGIVTRGGFAVTASFPVTGGRASLAPLGGTVNHKGGLKFYNVNNGTSLQVGNFIIDLSAGNLTGTVNGTSTRVPVFTLDLSKAGISVKGSTVTFTNVGLVLTDVAAGALNQTLGTSLFAGGLRFGSAKSTVKLRK